MGLTVEFCRGQIGALERERDELIARSHRAEGSILALEMVIKKLEEPAAPATEGAAGA